MAPPPRYPVVAIAVGCFAAIGGLLFGYDSGTIASVKAMPAWLRQYGYYDSSAGSYVITSSIESEVVSILSAGEFFGALVGAWVADAVGRRYGISIACAIFCIGVAFQLGSWEVAFFSVGRFVAGFGVGVVSAIVPMYQSETVPSAIRGAMVSTYQLAITIGLLIAAVIGNATSGWDSSAAYRVPIGIMMIFGALLGLGVVFLPESPRYYVRNGRDDLARKALAALNSLPVDDENVVAELDRIRANLEHERAIGSLGYADCFKQGSSKLALRTWTGIWLQAFQQLTGVNFIFYYGTTFFQQSGIQNAFLVNVITNAVNVASTFPGIYAVERLGRRNLLLIGAAGMCVCEFVVAATAAAVGSSNHAAQVVLIVFVCIYIAFFAASWGPVAWVVVNEIYPLNVRAKGVSMATASNWFWNFIIGFVTPYMVNEGTGNAGLKSNVFFIWGSTCAMCFVFAYFFVYETKGITLEQVDELYENSTARQSANYNAQLRAADLNAAGGADKA